MTYLLQGIIVKINFHKYYIILINLWNQGCSIPCGHPLLPLGDNTTAATTEHGHSFGPQASQFTVYIHEQHSSDSACSAMDRKVQQVPRNWLRYRVSPISCPKSRHLRVAQGLHFRQNIWDTLQLRHRYWKTSIIASVGNLVPTYLNT